jgi:hypothetical protein
MTLPYFDEERSLSLFKAWKDSGELSYLNDLLKLAMPIVERLIYTRGTTAFLPAEELLNAALVRLNRGLQFCYCPTKGRLFSFITKTTERVLIDEVRRKRSEAARVRPLDDCLLNSLSVNGADHRHAVADIHYRIMNIRTISACPFEQEAQRWLVRNLVESNFIFRRHECADSMSIVYGIAPNRSRKLFDVTVLSVRRALLGERKFKPVKVSELVGTRAKALVRYRDRLSSQEFARLVYLMKNLAPAIIETGEMSLSEILYGSCREKPLFGP